MTVETPVVSPEAPVPRKPRKVFLLVGIVLAAALGVGLFTSVGTKDTPTSGAPHDGGRAPAFSGRNLNGTGDVRLSASSTGGNPVVLLFFGNWCPQCHIELPPLASAVRKQAAAGGALSRVRVIGVDSEDTTANAKAFIHSSGVSFPVAYDPDLTITSGDYYFEGDPHAVFVNGDGSISAIVSGPLSPATFTADERALIPSGT
jgi:cytochrome c biogenesis protein CcmG, thiol:disulfide interchange protein DsbE